MSHLDVIKHQFHDLIDRVEDEAVLVRYLGAISLEVNGESSDFWDDLTLEQQNLQSLQIRTGVASSCSIFVSSSVWAALVT